MGINEGYRHPKTGASLDEIRQLIREEFGQ